MNASPRFGRLLLPLLLLAVVGLTSCRRSAPPAASVPTKPPRPTDARPDILLVTVENLRVDGVDGAVRRGGDSPLAGLAQGGIFFPNGYTPSPAPLPATGTILTGLPPAAHGAWGPGSLVDPSLSTLAARLAAAGWRTEAIVSSRRLARGTGVERGFAGFDDAIPEGLVVRSPLDTALAAKGRIEAAPAGPLFAWVHLTLDAGGPQDEPLRRSLDYGLVVKGLDAALAELLPAFGLRAVAKRVIVVAGTNGVELGERGERTPTGFALFEPVINVPIVLSLDGFAAIRAESPALLVDIAPTLLALAAIEPGDELPGRRLDELALAPAPVERPVLVTSRLPEMAGRGGTITAFRRGSDKLIESGGEAWFFDLAADPAETINTRAVRPSEFERLRRERESEAAKEGERSDGRRPAAVSPDPAALKSLGYF